MKNILTYRLFKEELSPELLNRAGEKLAIMGHDDRAQKLHMKANELSGDNFFNIKLFTGVENLEMKNSKFTQYEISICGFERVDDLEGDVNTWIDYYKENPHNNLTIEVMFDFRNDLDDRNVKIESDELLEYEIWENLHDQTYFTITFYISDIYDVNKPTLDYEITIDSVDIYLYNRKTKQGKSINGNGGIFTDRESALKFKKKIIEEKLLNDRKFRDILTRFIDAAGGEGEDYERFLKMVKNIRTNALYNNDGYIPNDISINLNTGQESKNQWK
jgi:hypothetical protein